MKHTSLALSSYLAVTTVDVVVVDDFFFLPLLCWRSGSDDCCKGDTDGDCLVTVCDDAEVTSPALTMQFNQTRSEFIR